ncbi:MAG: HEAT repeat domain-containing protein [Solirubrobacteraceae bacterium]
MALLATPQAQASARWREYILTSLAQLKDPATIPALERVVENDPKRGVRVIAMGALRAIGDRASVEFLARMLETSGDARIRAHAALGLANTGATKAVQPLIAALRDRSPTVRAAAAGGLRSLGDCAAVPALEDALRSTWSPPTRAAIKTALRRLR